MNKCVTTLTSIVSMMLVSCASSGGPSGGLIGGLAGAALGALGDNYIGSQENLGSTTIQNADGSTTVIDSNGQVSTTPGAGNTNNSVNVGLTGATTSTGVGTGMGTLTGTGFNGNNTNGGNTIITSNNTGSAAWRNHGGLITGALAGATAGLLTDSFRKRDAENKYAEGYAKAKSDAIKEFYWIKRDAQRTVNGGDQPPMQYRYYEVEVPAHTTADGVLIDRHRRVIEVVE
jgi:hypothetical protein